MHKTCFKCHRTLPISDFYRHPAMKGGRLGKCRECTKADVRRNRAERIQQYLDFDRSRANLPHRVEARLEYSRTDRGRRARRRAEDRWASENPHKVAAQNAVSNAVRDGKLVRKPCEVCGDLDSHGHHENYAEPLKVVWLCPKHHSARHAEIRRQSA